MKLVVDSLDITNLRDNIATLVMAVTYLSDADKELSKQSFSTTYNVLVDGEKEKAIKMLNAQAEAFIPDVIVRETFAADEAPAVIAESQAALDSAVADVPIKKMG